MLTIAFARTMEVKYYQLQYLHSVTFFIKKLSQNDTAIQSA